MHCTEADIHLFLEDKLPPERRQEVEAHLADCPACAETLVAAYRQPQAFEETEAPSLDAATLQQAEDLVSPRSPPSWRERILRLSRPARIALSVLLLAGVGLGLWTYVGPDATSPSSLRSPKTAPAWSLYAPPHRTVLEPPPVFRWARHPDAAAYRVLLYHNDGTVRWTGSTADTTLRLPSEVTLEDGARYLWRVEAVFPDDRSRSSELRAFTAAPE